MIKFILCDFQRIELASEGSHKLLKYAVVNVLETRGGDANGPPGCAIAILGCVALTGPRANYIATRKTLRSYAIRIAWYIQTCDPMPSYNKRSQSPFYLHDLVMIRLSSSKLAGFKLLLEISLAILEILGKSGLPIKHCTVDTLFNAAVSF